MFDFEMIQRAGHWFLCRACSTCGTCISLDRLLIRGIGDIQRGIDDVCRGIGDVCRVFAAV